MNGIERLQAAIDKLERQRAESSPGNWVAWRVGAPGREKFGVEADEHIADVVRWARREDVDMIVTLHRTIDAQLAILRDAEAYGDGNGPGHSYESSAASAAVWALALPLADAILGEVES